MNTHDYVFVAYSINHFVRMSVHTKQLDFSPVWDTTVYEYKMMHNVNFDKMQSRNFIFKPSIISEKKKCLFIFSFSCKFYFSNYILRRSYLVPTHLVPTHLVSTLCHLSLLFTHNLL